MHTFACIKIHIHINTYANRKQCQKRKYMCVYAEIYVCICGNICVYMRKYMCVYAHFYAICHYMQISTCINLDIHVNTYTHDYIYTPIKRSISTCINLDIHMNTYTQDYIYTPIKRQTPHDGKERNAFRRARGRHERLVSCVT